MELDWSQAYWTSWHGHEHVSSVPRDCMHAPDSRILASNGGLFVQHLSVPNRVVARGREASDFLGHGYGHHLNVRSEPFCRTHMHRLNVCLEPFVEHTIGLYIRTHG